MRKITIIPARSGSKGLPNKNILTLSEIPMFVWSILHAKYYSQPDDKIIVSSDSEKYLKIAKSYGAEAHERSPELAVDSAKTEPVMDEVISKLDLNDDDLLILLQPTSPIRKKETLDSLLEAFSDKECDSALTLSSFHGFLWENKDNFKNPLYSARPRRQDMKPRFQETGSVYITRYRNYKKTLNRVSGNITGIEVGFEESLEVDTLEEFQVIEAYFELHKNNWSEYL